MINRLFKVGAINIITSTENQFQLASGKLSPYYINAHYLIGTEYAANELLRFIDFQKRCNIRDSSQILNVLKECYKCSDTYGDVINDMVEFILEKIDIDEIDYVSGGERRDWFFSLMVADLIKKPHISLYKDLSWELPAGETDNGNVLHVSDTLTTGNSFEKYWLPVITSINSKIKWSLAVVDRNQGGKEKLAEYGIESYSMATVDDEFWDGALDKGYINLEQCNIVKEE